MTAGTTPASASPGSTLRRWCSCCIPFFVAPIFVVLVASFLENDGFGGMLPHFTLANYAGDLHRRS